MVIEGLTAGAVARRLGVAVTTLRTWHQRYGLGPSEHVPGHHRRYTEQDLDRLEVMRRLTSQGVAPAEAAAWAQRSSAAPSTGRAGGGHAIALGPVTPAARGLARAAMRLDAPAMRDILEMVVTERGVVVAWNEVAVPVLVGVGERYEATQRFVEVEHMLSRTLTEVLSSVPRPDSSVPPQVLLAGADEEQHTLPLEALAAALAEVGVPSRLLGARVPPAALSDAIERTGPAVVVLWSQTEVTSDPGQLSRVATAGHPPPLLTAAAGPGWPEILPDGVVQLTDLTSAVQSIAAAVFPVQR
ncbi:MerR family transcriptional regulator [Actinoplanes bogorensis]|uniref:MerR family transcriptional regulator n=1 Tax=Paractinoplanes bogorensis TaxID=1610840 RepID=A0ABS5Z335_9ACTN|nr:MerR family transcriptional regulator [Actinoplanes bogorensis]MBU2670120.1 MerR family transcriptional regulator [Actinoplanes bogorensis]